MSHPKRSEDPGWLATIWCVPDPLWEIIADVLAIHDPPKSTGRKRIDQRSALDGIIFRLRSGCQWNQLPQEFGDDSSVHRTFQRWVTVGALPAIWAALVEGCAELGGVSWEWQAVDCALRKARMGGNVRGPNPTDRAKPGTKTSLLVEEDGGPLSAVLAGANVPDFKLLDATLESLVVERPTPTPEQPQHLCQDKGYDNRPSEAVVEAYGYIPHIRRIGEEKLDEHRVKRFPARRWVVERTLAWLSKCRALLVRYDKHGRNYLGLLCLACALLWYRRYHRLCLSR